ncbi:unnamed protein product [Allacma fusca]|uniref:dUTPase-like domain-containing protein n=1 Tax=Allacma fusca TaxID=39272 RepID=A0A8J2KSS5_9HEXA|nr:unnamed protein product [Allacma fusca]
MFPPGGRERVKTGIQIELPSGTYIRLRERSPMATRVLRFNCVLKNRLLMDTCVEIEVILKYDHYKSAQILVGTRIGQLHVKPLAENLEVELVQELSQTKRGDNGFGLVVYINLLQFFYFVES